MQDDNPLSAIGADANITQPFSQQTYGSRIGTLTGGGGLNAAFDGNVHKPSWLSAASVGTLDSSYGSYVGINWQGNSSQLNLPSSFYPTALTHSLSAITIYAPFDRSFLDSTATGYVVQYSTQNSTIYANWTTLSSGTTAGTAGESISITITSTYTNPLRQFHRVAFQGNGTDYVSVAQVQFSVNETQAT